MQLSDKEPRLEYSEIVSTLETGTLEASQTRGHDTSKALFSLRKRGHFLRMKRALLCLLQSLGGRTCPQCPRFLRLCDGDNLAINFTRSPVHATHRKMLRAFMKNSKVRPALDLFNVLII